MRRQAQRSAPSPARTVTARTPWALSAAGVLLGSMAALAVHAPATWLAQAVNMASQGRVQLLQAQGTVWQGSAALVLAAPAGGTSAMSWPSRWSWRMRPDGWGIGVQLQSACCTPEPLRLKVERAGLHIYPAKLQMPMAVLQGWGTPWNTLQLQGDLHWQSQALSLPWQMAGNGWQGKIGLRAQQVSTRLSTLPQVGSYQIDVEGGNQPSLQISTLEGALHIEGQGQMQQGRWKFQGQAYAQPAQAQALANLLTLLGQRSGDKTKIQWG